MKPACRYRFKNSDHLREASGTLLLAIVATQGLHGEDSVRRDAAFAIDASINVLLVYAATQVGRDINAIFSRFATLEFGPEAFDVRLVETFDVLVLEVGR